MLQANLSRRGNSSALVVLLHAYLAGPESLDDVRRAVEEALPDADIAAPQLPFTRFSSASPSAVAVAVCDMIDGLFNAHQYGSVILLGHSVGALIARKTYVVSRGQTQDVERIAAEPRAWASRVERIILLAGMNRGWSLDKPYPTGLTAFRRFIIRVGTFLLWPLGIGKLMKKVRRGSPFIANLRVQWLNLTRSTTPLPPTIQILGDVDDVVSPEDTLDLDAGRHFTYLRVPSSGHGDVINFAGGEGQRRRAVLVRAVTCDARNMQSDFDMRRNVIPQDASVTEVVFIMHGIRDRGYWTKALGQHIVRYASERGRKVVASSSDYGYFAMLPFLILRARQNNVRWFMDQYTEAMALYPNAQFSFVGHSNGTYLLGGALRRYAPAAFNRVVLLGSVLPTKYPWRRFLADRRIAAIRNYVATRDWIVGIFPAAFELFGSQELGGAGHDGFSEQDAQQNQVEFVIGGHSAALDLRNWDGIAAFITDGEIVPPPSVLHSNSRNAVVVVAAKLCWLCWLILLGLLTWTGMKIFVGPGPMYFVAYLGLLLGTLLTI